MSDLPTLKERAAFACEFRVDGDPIAQPRPRARNAGRHARVYSPKRIKNSKGVIVDSPVYLWREAIVEAARKHRPAQPLAGPIRVELHFYFARPKRLLRRKDPVGRIWHTVKPDRDNLDKPVLDCLKNDGWYSDDSQVCDGGQLKFYVPKGGEPGLAVFVRQLDQAQGGAE